MFREMIISTFKQAVIEITPKIYSGTKGDLLNINFFNCASVTLL